MKSVNQKIFDRFLLHSVYIERFKNGEAKAISKLLSGDVLPALHTKIESFLARKRPVTRLKELESSLGAILEVASNKMTKTMAERLRTFSEYEARWATGTIQNAVPLDISMTMPSVETLRKLATSTPFDGHKLQTWIKGHSEAAKSRMMKQIRVGMVLGESLPEIGKRMRDVMSIKRKQAEAIARTAVSAVTNATREEVYKQNSDIIREVQWVATLDDRTTLVCINLDGRTFPTNEGPRPPAHFQCRSICIPVLNDWSKFGVEPPPPATRASMNGAVPEKTTYKDWLKKQSEGVQKRVLGATRFEAYKKGTPLSGFVGKNFTPLSLEQLSRVQKVHPEVVLTKKHVEAVKSWTMGDYVNIKRAELSGKRTPSRIIFEEAISSLPSYKGSVYRGGIFRKSDLVKSAAKPGTVFTMNVDNSGSKLKQVASGVVKWSNQYDDVPFSDMYILEVKTKNAADISKMSLHPKEQEVIFRRGSKYKIEGIKIASNGTTLIEATEI